MSAFVVRRSRVAGFVTCVLASALCALAQQTVDVTAHLEGFAKDSRSTAPSAALWLTPPPGRTIPFSAASRKYTLLQKNKTFSPHLLIVPVGAVVSFPNADPFFHNVFSLFDGKRFDLGLYEAGSTKEVTFSREGVSYIFCNIHPEMSAVVLALSTPYFSIGEGRGVFRLHGVPPGTYEMHLWMEGEEAGTLRHMSRSVVLSKGHEDLGALTVSPVTRKPLPHANKFGEPYDRTVPPSY